MEFWSSYSLNDFLSFSAASYFRRFELANAELWPGQLLIALVSVALLWFLRRPRPGVALWVALILSAAWLLVAGLFLFRHYAQLNFVANWFALAFVLQALLLGFWGWWKHGRQQVCGSLPIAWWHPGLLLTIYALLIYPLTGFVAGRSWSGVELFALSPDVTAVATLGILLSGPLKRAWPLMIIPFIWCLFSALTYLAMGLLYGVTPVLLAVTALIATGLHSWKFWDNN